MSAAGTAADGRPTRAARLPAGAKCHPADSGVCQRSSSGYGPGPVAADLSEPVRRFIAQHVHSAGQLEVLLLLRAVPDREWSAEEVARAQVSTRLVAEQMLEDISRRGLASRTGEPRLYCYAPPADLAPVIDDLAAAYATRRVTVVGLIFSKPSSAVTGLADAFRIRKDR